MRCVRLAALLLLAIGAPCQAQMLLSGAGASQTDQMAGLIASIPQASWKDTGKTVSQAFYANDTTNSFSRPALGADYNATVASTIFGAGGPSAIFLAWGGATVNTDLGQLIIYGGDHNDYLGNEIYVFDFKTLTPQRV
jgi:hypothetical protein